MDKVRETTKEKLSIVASVTCVQNISYQEEEKGREATSEQEREHECASLYSEDMYYNLYS